MLKRKTSALADGYGYEVDTATGQAWHQLLREFDDSNLSQTWAYAAVEEGPSNLSTLKLTFDGQVVAIALARFRRLPLISMGLAYVHRGPIWRRKGMQTNVEHFRQVIRALRNEFVCRRGLTLRLNPVICDDAWDLIAALAEENFLPSSREAGDRTILMDLTPSLPDLRAGLDARWRRGLKTAEKNQLEIIEGTSEELFDRFIQIHGEMAARKGFVVKANPRHFRKVQAQLPEDLKMRVVLCASAGEVCAGTIYTQIGNNAALMFGAISNSGMKSRGSHLVNWRVVEELKQRGTTIYDLNGIDPVANYGTYVFKRDLAGKHGREVTLIGKYDASAGFLSHSLIRLRDALRRFKTRLQESVSRPAHETVPAAQQSE